MVVVVVVVGRQQQEREGVQLKAPNYTRWDTRITTAMEKLGLKRRTFSIDCQTQKNSQQRIFDNMSKYEMITKIKTHVRAN